MKDWIKQTLRENLEEIKTMEKPKFGSGVEHNVYSSSKNPNVLFKVGEKETVLKWVEIFNSNNTLFPEVYRLGTLKNGKLYAEIEKLNTSRASSEFNKIFQFIEQSRIPFNNTILRVKDLWRWPKEALITIKKFILNNNQDKNIYSLMYNWSKFLVKLINVLDNHIDYLDIHNGNFGYDKKGMLKCIDI